MSDNTTVSHLNLISLF